MDYEQHLDGIMSELSAWSARRDAIEEIKNNPDKYPEFDFWVPGYDADGWADKAIKDFDKLVPELRKQSVVFKLCVMRCYRKLAQQYRKAGDNHLVGSEQHAEDTIWCVKNLHPEFFKEG